MKKRKIGEVRINSEKKAEFIQSRLHIINGNNQNYDINYGNVIFLQEMMLEEKNEKKFVLGLYIDSPSTKQIPSLTFTDFANITPFLEAFSSIKQSIPLFEKEITGFYAYLLIPKQKPKKYELGLTNKQILLRPLDETRKPFFKIDVNNCDLECVEKKLKITISNCQIKTLFFDERQDINKFVELFFMCLEESTKDQKHIFDEVETIDQLKLFILENEPYLKSLYATLVLNGEMTEEAFWNNREEFKEYNKYYLESKQQTGKNNFHYFEGKIPSIVEKQGILNKYPDLQEIYLKNVGNSETNPENDKAFWNDFMNLQQKYDTEIIGGKNPIKLPIKTTNLIPDVKKVRLDQIPLGEVDLVRNLDSKTNIAENFMTASFQQGQESVILQKPMERTIKRLQTHGLSLLGGVEPSSTLTELSNSKLINEFEETVPTGFELHKYNSKPLNNKKEQKILLQNFDEEHMTIEANHPVNTILNESGRINNLAIVEKLKRLNENKESAKNFREIYFNRDSMSKIFKDLIQDSNLKEESIEDNYLIELYESFHEQGNVLLKIFYANNEDKVKEVNLNSVKNLIIELLNKINIELANLERGVGQKSQNMREYYKFRDIMESVIEPLRNAVSNNRSL